MPPKKPTTSRASKSKAEIESEFEAIVETHSSADALDPKAAEVAKRNAEQVRKVSKGMSVDAVVKDIGTLGLDVGKALADIQQKIQSKVLELAQLQDAVKLEQQELEILHGKDIVASQIANLIADHNDKKAKLTEEVTQLKQKFADERAALDKAQKEFDAEMKKTRAREAADYEYTKATERKRLEDDFNEKLRAQERIAKETQESLQKIWTAREDALKFSEKELSDLRAQAATFPETTKKEVDKAVAVACNSVKRDHDNTLKIAQMQADSDKRALTQEVEAQKKVISQLETQVISLREEMAKKSEQVVSIASKAVESASGRTALDSIKEMQASQQSGPSNKK